LEATVKDEKEELMAKAKKLGLKPHPATGVKKLKALIAEA